ncbi:MAG: GNAT family N-acetyltransferase [Chloroflexi bacterium]|nr:GNAT family N-acetyltransferase [Chloroflexota bacterium]
MEAGEIPLIASIDRSDIALAEYTCRLADDGLGLSLVSRPLPTPALIPNWNAQELEFRFELWRRNLAEGAALFGAFEQERLAGFVLVGRSSNAYTAEVYSLFVDRAYRCLGIGTLLLARAECQCAGWGCDDVILYTGYHAHVVDFYLRRGYRVAAIQDPAVKTKNFPLTLAKSIHPEQTSDFC